jgi:hypothetical protein
MKHIIKNPYLFLCILFLHSSSFGRDVNSIYPYPKTAWNKPGQFIISSSTTIILANNLIDSNAVNMLQSAIFKAIGVTLKPGNPVFKSGSIIFGADMSSVTPEGEPSLNIYNNPGGYRLDVSYTNILIEGSFSNAVTTLIQLFNVSGNTITINNAHVFDYADYSDRWVFSQHNLLVGSQVSALEAIADTMALYKLNGIQQNDFKYSILQLMGSNYFQNVDSLSKHLQKEDIEIIPGVIGLGWSSGILYNDPNLAEGLPARATYAIESDTGRLIPDARVTIANGGFEDVGSNGQFSGWSFYDGPNVSSFQDKTIFHSGLASAKCTNFIQGNSSGNCRFSTLVNCDTNKYYSMSAWVKTQDLQGGFVQMLALGGVSGQTLTFTQLAIDPTMDWTRVEVNFNTLGNNSVRLYIGIWGGQTGTIWFDDFAIREAGLASVLRRGGCPLSVQNKNTGKVYSEGADFAKVVDPLVDAHKDSYFPYHTPPTFSRIKSGMINNGDTVVIQYYHPFAAISDNSGNGSVMACVSEDTLYKILNDQVTRVNNLYHPQRMFMGHDEIRNMNHDKICLDRKKSPADLLSDNIKRCYNILNTTDYVYEIFMWSDMVDSLHNAMNNYYLVNGDLRGDWDSIPKNITIVNWNGANAKQSLQFFNNHGFKQITSPYYDAGNTSTIRSWRIAQQVVPYLKGMMYTTWQNDYRFLRAFGYYSWGAGPNIIHTPLDTTVLSGSSFQITASVIADPYDNADKVSSVFMNIIDTGGNIVTSYPLTNTNGNVYNATIPNLYSKGFRYNITATNLQGLTRTLPTYIIKLPQAPNLILPYNNSTDSILTQTFSWSTVYWAEKYRLQISKDFNFSTTIVDTVLTANSCVVGLPVTPSKYSWHVQSIDDAGGSLWSMAWDFTIVSLANSVGQDKISAPSLAIFPNPVNNQWALNYSIGRNGIVTVKLYNTLGKVEKVLFDGALETGEHSMTFGSNDIPSGNYILELSTSEGLLTKEIQVVK